MQKGREFQTSRKVQAVAARGQIGRFFSHDLPPPPPEANRQPLGRCVLGLSPLNTRPSVANRPLYPRGDTRTTHTPRLTPPSVALLISLSPSISRRLAVSPPDEPIDHNTPQPHHNVDSNDGHCDAAPIFQLPLLPSPVVLPADPSCAIFPGLDPDRRPSSSASSHDQRGGRVEPLSDALSRPQQPARRRRQLLPVSLHHRPRCQRSRDNTRHSSNRNRDTDHRGHGCALSVSRRHAALAKATSVRPSRLGVVLQKWPAAGGDCH